MADPATGGANSHLQSQLAAGSGGGSEGGTSPLTWVMTFGNIGGANIFKAGQHFANALGLGGIFTNAANSLGLKNIMGGDKLAKSPFGKPLSKKAKPMGASNFSVAAGGPSIAPPSLGGGSGAPMGGSRGHD